MQFSISFFSMTGNDEESGCYQLLLDAAKFADEHGFSAIWVPERHFQEFGGAFPNPSVVAAAIAAITKNIRIRAGSIVLPLHHPLRVVEEWSVVDNLSDGRVDLSFAAGWHPSDFVLSKARYEDRRKAMRDTLEIVRDLWSGKPRAFTLPSRTQLELLPLPRPVQKSIHPWITTSGNPDTWRLAGTLGAAVLGALIGDTLSGLAEKNSYYRNALATSGFPRDQAHTTLMLHTFISEDDDMILGVVRPKLENYIRSYMKQKEDPGVSTKPMTGMDIKGMSEMDRRQLAAFAAHRYLKGTALLGAAEKCGELVDQLAAVEVDEIACLIDFGVPKDLVMRSLVDLDRLRQRYSRH